MKGIVTQDNPVLRQKARTVNKEEVGSENLAIILSKMKIALHSQVDGIAIAAPQIGESIRVFIVSGSLLKKADSKYKGDEKDLIFINPKLVKISKEKKLVEEGCLSVRWLYGKVNRATRVSLEALNEKGESISRGASGLLAQIFQHETDHLNGKLFIDSAQEVWEMSKEEIAELERENSALEKL